MSGAKKRQLKDLTIPHGIIYGFAQSLALIPGVSRSGGTITAGLFLGYKRPAAARYAFLLAIPAVFGSGLYQLFKSFERAGRLHARSRRRSPRSSRSSSALGVIAFLMSWISKHSFLPFVIYRLALGTLLLVLLSIGVLQAY